jgi:hypothetical protein
MICLLAVALIASNFAGTWTGTMTGKTTIDPAFMVLAQDGQMITGSIGPDRDAQFKITKSSLDGDTLTIEAQPGGTFRFVMKMDGDKLAGEVFEDGQLIGTIRFERVKQ